MLATRVIARLDIKGTNLIKGVHLEGLRVVGDPQIFAKKYYDDGIDEIIYIDSVASLYGRNNLTNVIKHAASEVFVPMTVGGGVRSLKDVETILRSGADKISINTAAIRSPKLITDIANEFGSQCVVVNIEAKEQPNGSYEAYVDNGRERTGKDAISWAKEVQEMGAGEILLTSIDREGTLRGYDTKLVGQISSKVRIPVIASGGMGCAEDCIEVVKNFGAHAVAIAHVLHYGKETVSSLKEKLGSAGISIRSV